MCNGLRGHQRLKQVICDIFEDEYTEAQREYERLMHLFKDVCWYNFETRCRDWRHPWPQSYDWSPIELCGVNIKTDYRNGRAREIGEFPVYYSGPIRDAPPLPPEIITTEIQAAAKRLKQCEENCRAPHEWAPGGKRYNQLLRDTTVPTEYSKKRVKAQKAADRISKHIQKQDK